MTEFAIISYLVSIGYFVTTLVVAALLLRWFDWTLGIKFKRDVWEKLNAEPLALALYHGLRLLAVFILGAAFVS